MRRFNSRISTSPAAVLTTTRSPRRIGVPRGHHDDVAVAIGRPQRVAGNLQRKDVVLAGAGRQRNLVPAASGRKTVRIEMAGVRGL